MYDKSISIEDRVEIHDLYARYCHTADALDGELFAQCFAKDGFIVPGINERVGEEIRGRQALADLINAPSRRARKARHWNSNILLEREGGRVKGLCYAVVLRVDISGHPAITASLVYHDTLIQEDGFWRFLQRIPRHDGA